MIKDNDCVRRPRAAGKQFTIKKKLSLNFCMKQVLIKIVLIALLSVSTVNAQNLEGKWEGVLTIQKMSLKLAFNVRDTNMGYSATMDSPDQGAFDIPVTTTEFQNSKVRFFIKSAGIDFNGQLKGDSISGSINQSGMELPLTLHRIPDEQESTRPQEADLSNPEKLPYTQEAVTINNISANVQLSGTLTIPKSGSNFPAVILISGSGAQDRNEELLGHKPFMVIADYFSRNGIAVLRYDDRGYAFSTGDFSTATTADFATDAAAAVQFLKTRTEINPKQIGLAGHSEGGIIAPMVATDNKDVAFIILMAGTGIKGDSILMMQMRYAAKEEGKSDAEFIAYETPYRKILNLLTSTKATSEIKNDLKKSVTELMSADSTSTKISKEDLEKTIDLIVEQMSSPWMRYFVSYNPAPALTKVKCPVLAINGDKDMQVPSAINLNAIGNALKQGGNKHYTLKEFAGKNHLFQTCTTGAMSEYHEIRETFSPEVMAFMLNWILKESGR